MKLRFSICTALTILATPIILAAGTNCEAPSPSSAPSTIDKEKFTQALKAICPNAAKQNCTDDPKAPGQCRTASQAAEPILRSFSKYNITEKTEMAALVSLMALESGEFKYQKNIYPGRPGQGTRNMQMPEWNTRYAASIPELKDQLKGPACNDKVKTLDLLLSKDDYDFGSAAWYLTTQCKPDVRKGLQEGTKVGWEKYITSCIQTTVSEERSKYWQSAIKEMKEL
ncbi:predicted protein [Uncinocarpus reesii 1704]|uniref:Transglycosylase SLT domain-containing protein n=1 Tax=Uncinocarpus reesii (strain UAMH 1704) TaxID=336963 RepID=C4JPU7_UNCRE|nr:uncharacterized protein UREG_04590 [Uncinocarpus reesii 1704]EEP79744.1 predicted protein [Uncinocarpus reesii 1704]